jgi:transposase InsO family protein
MAWGEVDVHERRVRFVVAAAECRNKHESFAALCRRFEISRQTGYTWLGRYTASGVAGVVEGSRRPKRSPGQTSAELEAAVVAARAQRPDWGARKLRFVLQAAGVHLPVITIHRILVRRGLVAAEDRHRPALQRFERAAPNELWQMDFKGPAHWNAPTGPLSLLDDHSRYALELYATGSTRAEPVRERLEGVFRGSGVPQAMLMDHGTPWWNMASGSGWTGLTVWLMRQGIRLYFSAYRHPQTQGKVERFHGSLERALRRRGSPAPEAQQAWLDRFRQEYNQERPHEALGMRTPASLWLPSARAYQPEPPEWEYPAGAEVYRLGVAGQLFLGNRRWEVSRALAHQQVQLIRLQDRILVFYCETLIREFDLQTGTSVAVAAL